MLINKVKSTIILLMMTFLVACSSVKEPENVAVKYVNALIGADIDTFMSVVYLPEAEKQQLEMMRGKMSEMLQAASAAAQMQGGIKSVKALSTSYSDDKQQATVKVRIEYKQGQTEEELVSLVQVNNDWKVSL